MTHGARIYNLYPSLIGPIARWTEHLPRIAAMHFDWVYLNPFQETGYSGSLYAVKSYERLNPLFRGDARAPDDALLRGFVNEARSHGLAVMMDLVVNHTARDAELTVTHPEWYRHDEQGAIASPSAANPDDTREIKLWTDLAELDFRPRAERAAMIRYFTEVVRHYAGLGFRGFRCDAAYKVPAEVWSEIIAAAREVEPDAMFAAETLGAPIEAVAQLRPAGFDYLFNSSKWWDFHSPWLLDQYERFRHIAPSIAFPESHDTPRLSAELTGRSDAEIEAEYRFRYLFAAFFSSGVLMPVGYEFGFARRLDVVMTRPQHWEAPRFDLSSFIAEVNAMKAALPVLNEEGPERALAGGGTTVGLIRNAAQGAGIAVALLNPDPSKPTTVDAPRLLSDLDGSVVDVTPAADAVPPLGAVVLQPLEMRIFTSADGARLPGPGAHVAAGPCTVEDVWPELNAGRYPVKGVVGEHFSVYADIFREGHDALSAVLRHRERGATVWRETPLVALDNDRWSAGFTLERNTRYEYTLEAWPDAFASWRRDVRAKREAGQPLELELREGLALVEAATQRAAPADRIALGARLEEVRRLDGAARIDALLDDALAALVARAPDRRSATRYDRVLEVVADRRAAQFGAWYEFFPRSEGTLADATARLPEVRALGFDVVYVPPIHPIGRSHRKGRNNTLDGATGRSRQPVGHRQRRRRPHRDRARARDHGGLRALRRGGAGQRASRSRSTSRCNASPDHPYVREHPEWFAFRPDGSIKFAENPPKKYQDIVNFDFVRTPTRPRCGRSCATWSCSGSATACASSASTIRTPSRSRSGNG